MEGILLLLVFIAAAFFLKKRGNRLFKKDPILPTGQRLSEVNAMRDLAIRTGNSHIAPTSKKTQSNIKTSIARPEVGPKKDFDQPGAWEGSFWDVDLPKSVSAVLQLDYIDGKGQRTNRTVDVRQFGRYGNGCLLIGTCELRKATRTFRTDRIKECVDTETGELIENVQKYLENKYNSSPEAKMNNLLFDEFDTIRALYYIGKADGRLTKREITIIANTCRDMSNESKITDEIVKKTITGLDIPSAQAFKMAITRISKDGMEKLERLHGAAKRIIETEKTIHSSEQEAIDYIEKRLSKLVASERV